MKILLAVDGSQNALNAVDSALRLAAALREAPQIELVAVQPAGAGPAATAGREQLKPFYEEEARRNLAQAEARLAAAGVACRPQVLAGAVAETLARFAGEAGCDLIVAGSRGMTAAASAILGSTSSRLLQIAPVPVVLVR